MRWYQSLNWGEYDIMISCYDMLWYYSKKSPEKKNTFECDSKKITPSLSGLAFALVGESHSDVANPVTPTALTIRCPTSNTGVGQGWWGWRYRHRCHVQFMKTLRDFFQVCTFQWQNLWWGQQKGCESVQTARKLDQLTSNSWSGIVQSWFINFKTS